MSGQHNRCLLSPGTRQLPRYHLPLALRSAHEPQKSHLDSTKYCTIQSTAVSARKNENSSGMFACFAVHTCIVGTCLQIYAILGFRPPPTPHPHMCSVGIRLEKVHAYRKSEHTPQNRVATRKTLLILYDIRDHAEKRKRTLYLEQTHTGWPRIISLTWTKKCKRQDNRPQTPSTD